MERYTNKTSHTQKHCRLKPFSGLKNLKLIQIKRRMKENVKAVDDKKRRQRCNK